MTIDQFAFKINLQNAKIIRNLSADLNQNQHICITVPIVIRCTLKL
jgi:hypothetical protein